MINELREQYEEEVARLKDAVEVFVTDNKPKYMPVNLGEAYRLRELDSTIKQLTEVEDKLACLTKNFVGKEEPLTVYERFGMPTFDDGHSN